MLNFIFTKTPLLFLTQSFWRDEAFSYFMAKKNIAEIIFLTAKDFNPPLYYFILHFWMKIFGESEVAIRSLSIVFFWATIYVVFLFITEVFKIKQKKAFLYLILFIVNPLLLYYAFEARMYSMLAFFSTLSFYALYKKKLHLYLLASILGMYTHYFMVFVLLGQYIHRRFKQKYILFAFLPWIIYMIFNKNFAGTAFWIHKPSLINLLTFVGTIFSSYEPGLTSANRLIISFSFILWLIIIFAFIVNQKSNTDHKKIFRLLSIWAVGIPLFIMLISFIKPIFLDRYLIFSTVGLLLLLVYSMEKMSRPISVVLLIFFIVVSICLQSVQLLVRAKLPVKKSILEIKSLMKKDDLLYVASELDYFTVLYYFQEDRVYIYGKNYEDIPDYIGKVLISKEKIASNLPFYPKKAFILNSDGRYDIQAMY